MMFATPLFTFDKAQQGESHELQKSTPPESILRDIKRKTPCKFTAEEKIRIVLEGLRGEVGIADLCQREGIHTTMYYKWSKAFLEAGQRQLTGHPMIQGKIERYFRSMKNLILLDHYYSPSELEERIREWVAYCNNHRYREAVDIVTPRDKYYGRDKEILKNRMKTKKQTVRERRKINKMIILDSLSNGIN